jgi:hypothetical protein
MKKPIHAPFVSQGILSKSDATQGRAFREAAESYRLKHITVTPGKGLARRFRQISLSRFDKNWDRIFGPRKR